MSPNRSLSSKSTTWSALQNGITGTEAWRVLAPPLERHHNIPYVGRSNRALDGNWSAEAVLLRGRSSVFSSPKRRRLKVPTPSQSNRSRLSH